jgi:hypothetical protein
MRRLALILLLSLSIAPAYAHKPSDSYLALSLAGDRLSGQWDIALRDLDYAIGLDADGNGEITWGEVKAKHKEIAAYALARLAIDADGVLCPLTFGEHLIDNHSDGAYAVLRFAAHCAAVPRVLTVRYTLLFDLDPQHRGLLRFEQPGQTLTAVFSPDRNTWQSDGHRRRSRDSFSNISRPESGTSGPGSITYCFFAPCCCRQCSITAAADGRPSRPSARHFSK